MLSPRLFWDTIEVQRQFTVIVAENVTTFNRSNFGVHFSLCHFNRNLSWVDVTKHNFFHFHEQAAASDLWWMCVKFNTSEIKLEEGKKYLLTIKTHWSINLLSLSQYLAQCQNCWKVVDCFFIDAKYQLHELMFCHDANISINFFV